MIASGKITTGFQMAARLAAGADLCLAARGFMFALGCIQARRCNTNACPVGVATQNDKLVRGLDVVDKTTRVANFHQRTVEAFMELLAAAGLEHPSDLKPFHLQRRISQTQVRSYDEIYEFIEPGELLKPNPPEPWRRWLERTRRDPYLQSSI